MRGSVKIEGLNELNRAFKSMSSSSADKTMGEGVEATADEVLEDSQRRLTEGGHRVTDELYKSGKVTEIDTLNYSTDYDAEYALYVEFGRKAGKRPPSDNILEWVINKGIATLDSGAKSVAFLIARSIGRKGSKPHPFLFPAFELKSKNIYDNLKESFNKLTKKVLK